MVIKFFLEKLMFLFGWLFVICILVFCFKGSVYFINNNYFIEGWICFLE